MHPFAKSLSLSACALAAALLVSACGGGETTDTEAPTVTITDNVAEATATGPVAFTFTFSEEVKDFTAEDVVVTGGDKAATVTKVSATEYTLLVTPTAGGSGTISVSIPAGKFTDLANNTNAAVSAVEQAYDTVPAAGSAINFEVGGRGAAFTWTAFDNGGALAPAVVDNPSKAGINTSDKALRFSLASGAAWYTGMESKHGVGGVGSDLGTTVMSPSNAVLKMKVYKPLISDVGMKLVREDSGSEGDVRVANTKVNEWEELTFNFCGKISSITTVDQLVIFPDFNALDVGHTNSSVSYVDDITFNACPAPSASAPTNAPMAPTALAANVISLYSDAYTTATGTDTPNWGQSTVVSNETIASNNVLKLKNYSYQGVQMAPANVTAFSKLHIDFWSDTATSIEVKLVSLNPTKENSIYVPVDANTWTSKDIDLSLFTAADKTKVEQLILGGGTGGTLFIDNVYFSKDQAASAPTNAPTAPTALAANVISLYSDAYTTATGTDTPNWGQSTVVSNETIASNNVLKLKNYSYQGVQMAPANVTAFSKLHIDFWSDTAMTIEVKLVSLNPLKENAIFVPITANSWNSKDIDLSQFTAADKTKVEQLILGGGTGGTLFIDNVYFGK